jgi:short-subunit dehydrogenase
MITGKGQSFAAMYRCYHFAGNSYRQTVANVYSDDNVRFFKCDITTKENVDAVAAEIKETLGAPSILCNNAGIAHAHTMLESSPGYLKKLFDINVIAHFYTIQAFLPDMIERKKGHIVSTCSMSSFVTPAGLVDYAASKAAVMAMHEGLQSELKYRYNAPEIRTTVVHPIYVRTPLCDSFAKALEKSGAFQLSPDTVGNEIVAAVLSGSSRQIILPRTLALSSALRAFPWWFQEVARGTVKDDMKRL